MKEAASEANLTVVAIILIGVIVAVATPIINSMMNTTKNRADCMNNGGYWSDTTCVGATQAKGTSGGTAEGGSQPQ